MTTTYRPSTDKPTNRSAKPIETVGWWHWFHRWTRWQDGTVMVMFKNSLTKEAKDIQWRRCVICNKKRERYMDD